MNIYEELNDKVVAFLEGEVIDFAKYKKEKEVDELTDGVFDDNNTIKVRIQSVSPKKCVIEGVDVFDEIAYSVNEFQTKLMALNKLYAIDRIDENPEIVYNYSASTLDQVLAKGDDGFTGTLSVHITDCRYDYVITNAIVADIEKKTGKQVIVVSDEKAILHDEVDAAVDEYRKLFARATKGSDKKVDFAPAKDYSNEGAKYGQDVEVGDILYSTLSYGSTSYTFYKVVERKPASIKLVQLAKSTQMINDDDGRVVPTEGFVKNNYVDGKTIRIHKSRGDWDNVVCKVNDYNCYYWNGQPKRETYMD